MGSSRKKVILRRFTRDWVAGYLPASDFAHDGSLEVLDLAGKVLPFSIQELKWACFVRDFNSGEIDNPERLIRKTSPGGPAAKAYGSGLSCGTGSSGRPGGE